MMLFKFANMPEPKNDADKGMCNCIRDYVTLEHQKTCSRYPNPLRQSRTKP
ncbi:hypothetical protein PS2_034 [Serratia phage PS2]|uniref:Uncharacterized protein n=1 Tax=Serratia phage PS2 TaxID=1481112 RepID=A0A023W4N3_9CAUD|nr:hypothetical protein FF83_gp034 [Serratia phage PS2]AHY25284.1 hypothetical protein PS2_034 [Serratia phage PS2]